MQGEVPCDGCTTCCTVKGRYLELEEIDQHKFKQFESDGKIYLAQKEDDSCIYFEGHCTIYDSRPHACRVFDCRDFLSFDLLPVSVRVEAERRVVNE